MGNGREGCVVRATGTGVGSREGVGPSNLSDLRNQILGCVVGLNDTLRSVSCDLSGG